MANKFTYEDHQKRMRDILTRTPRQPNMGMRNNGNRPLRIPKFVPRIRRGM